MRNLDFKYAAAQNFLPFGPEGIELEFKKYGNIVLIQGENKDAKAIDPEDISDLTKTNSNGSGKCFGVNTPILMFDGTIKLVQNVCIGDLIMGPDSQPRKVLSLGCGTEQMYEIKPKKGNSYVVNKSHILTLKPMFKNRGKNQPDVLNISVEDFIQLPEWKQKLYGTYRVGVDFVEQKLPVDPYILGIWLGDGTTSKPEITTADRPILDAFANEALNRGLRSRIVLNGESQACKVSICSFNKTGIVTSSKICLEVHELAKSNSSIKSIASILSKKYKRLVRKSSVHRWLKQSIGPTNENSFIEDLRSLGLNDTKFVPDIYKINSRENRLQVLAGLLDTDGSLAGECGFDFSNKNQKIAEDCAFLARSLGLAANVTKCKKQCVNNGKWGIYYRVSIYGNGCHEIPVRILRKKAKIRTIEKDHLKTRIEVIALKEDQYYGFTVDQDSLFLLGDFTVVHNSSVQEIIVWTLYGKTIKRPEKIKVDQVIHNKIGKDCRTVVDFDKYRVVRCRSFNGKDSLQLWESEQGIWDKTTEKTSGDMRQTQKEIEKRIGLSYDSFVNICIFTDDQRSCFLECDQEAKREIVENLMQLGIYREWYENAKLLKKDVKSKIDGKSKEFTALVSNKDNAQKRLLLTEKKQKDWFVAKQAEKSALEDKVSVKSQTLGKTDTGAALLAYQEAQNAIITINEQLPELKSSKDKIVERLALVRTKDVALKKDAQEVTESFNLCAREIKFLLTDRNKLEADIQEKQSASPGSICDACVGIVAAENIEKYVANINRKIVDINLEIQKYKLNSDVISAKVAEIKTNQAKLKQLETQTEQKLATINDEISKLQSQLTKASQVREPKAESAELLLQQQIEELNRQIAEKEKEIAGSSPFDDILENDKEHLENIIKDVENMELEVKQLEEQIPYYDYWIHGFGPDGIRKWIIDGIIPDLNSRINYWLQFLIDNVVTLKFDNKLKETIERNPPDGDPYIYYIMSTGQRRRLNLAVGHSFAYITELSSDAVPSLIFLDEVTTNIDKNGVRGIYNMILELAQDKQVFVTTHDPELEAMLQGVSEINLIHENGFTRLVK